MSPFKQYNFVTNSYRRNYLGHSCMVTKKQVFVNLQQLPISLKLQPLFRVKEMQFEFFFLPVDKYLFLIINVSHDIMGQHIIYVVLN